jgi:hypothetical protein
MKTERRGKSAGRTALARAVPALLLAGGMFAAAETPARNVTVACDTFAHEIAPDGRNVRFVDKASGTDYLAAGDSYCASAKKGGETFRPAAVALRDDGTFAVRFAGGDISADIRAEAQEGRVVYEVKRIEGDPDELVFLNVPLRLEGMPWEPFAACALKLNLFTHVHQLPALQTGLRAVCYRRFGLEGAKAAAVGVPQGRILPVLRDILTKAAPEIPFGDQGGAWALSSKEGYGSYLMNFGSLTEATVDEWIANCRRIGFNQIDNHGGSPAFFLFGSFELDKKKFPEGWQSFKKIVDRLRAAGISSILHTYACYIAPGSRYVTPVPHPGLDTVAAFTLAGPVSAADTEIAVRESTAGVSLDVGYMVTHNRTVRIGDEIVRFDGVTREAPFKFTGCQRGFHGTRAAAHASGGSAAILKTFWSGLYVPAPDSPLFDEIAKNTADVINECGFDGLYLDAIEGIRHMWGEKNYWYYGDRFVFEIVKHLKRPIGMEYAGMTHGWWLYRSRYQAWDSAARGYKRFTDIHIAAMKANTEYQHGCWRGHLPLIEKYAPLENYPLFLPLQLGWWRFHTWRGPKTEPTYRDDIEYLCCKMIGNNAGLSLNCDIGEATLKAHPVYREFLAMIKQYEELRHADTFDASVREKLRQVGKEHTLAKGADGRWTFKPVFYRKHKVCGPGHPTAKWTLDNEFANQPVRLRLEALVSVDREAQPEILLDAESAGTFGVLRTAEGVACSLKPGGGSVPATGEVAAVLTGRSAGAVPREGTWAAVGRTFEPALDLGKKQALGVWVCGDGSGALLDFRVTTRLPHWGMCSHYVPLDFTGWRYVELVEAESTRSSDYIWPEQGGYFVYDHYREVAAYNRISSFEIWLNNLPADRDVSCKIGPVRALETAEKTLKNPALTLNGAALAFPVEMASGMYLELGEGGQCRLYDKDGKTVRDFALPGAVPLLKNGRNEVAFACEGDGAESARVQVTLIGEGAPIDR